MATLTYAYVPGTEVFYVDATTGVRDAIVRNLTASITLAGTTLSYDIAFKNPAFGSLIASETSLYADVDSALAAYRPLVIIP